MESGDILDSQLSASSEGQWTLDGEPFLMSASNGRLNNDGLASCWESATNDEHQWLQVHLGEYYVNVTRVATQGCGREEEWVTSYKLQYSNDGVNFQYYMEKGQNTEKASVTYYKALGVNLLVINNECIRLSMLWRVFRSKGLLYAEVNSVEHIMAMDD